MDINVSGNRAQLPLLVLGAKRIVAVHGRGTGKSFSIGFIMNQNVLRMPKSITTITGKTFGQLLTRTLPSSLKLLNQVGFQQGVNYVIGRRPPSYFKESYEAINRFDNIISFSNGTRFALISQSEAGSGRGANSDYEIVDEALTIDEEQYNNEVAPTNRGNNEFFGPKSKNPVPWHHGFTYMTSMPTDKKGRWVLKYADYYLQERGIRLFDVWNRIVSLEVDMLDVVRAHRVYKEAGNAAAAKDALAEFKNRWAEINRLKAQIQPFVSKDGTLFTVSNAFDNLDMLGMSYILNSQDKMPNLIFLVEIMNIFIDKVVDCYYNIDEAKQVYYNSLDNGRLLGMVQEANFSFENAKLDCSYDRDCDPSKPLDICFDWGSSISLMIVAQERHWDFVANAPSEQPCHTQINEFFTKPDTANVNMIDDLIGSFCAYYAKHPTRELHYYRDKYGDHKNPAVFNNRSYNEMAIEALKKSGWRVVEHEHSKMEPAQSDRYKLWMVVLSENNPAMPKWRINGDKCRYTLISMNNAKVKQVDNKLVKVKTSERPDSGVLPEEATHFSDCSDKLLWTKYGETVRSNYHSAGFTGFLDFNK